MQCAEEAKYRELVKERDEASDAYMDAIKAYPPVRERTKIQQAVIDNFLGIYQKAAQKVWHYGII